MAVIYRATLVPTKLELLQAWLPSRSWAGTDSVQTVGTYRFDDPAGEVGIETFLLRTDDGRVLQVPLTYRGAPLAGAEDALVGTTEHSVLGRRWVYDGCADPVWAGTIAGAILTGGVQADEVFENGERRQGDIAVFGTGSAGADTPDLHSANLDTSDRVDTTVVATDGLQITLARVVGAEIDGDDRLYGSWAGKERVVLAAVRRPSSG